jgi:NDP-sugar pyrophosphorylase family protein
VRTFVSPAEFFDIGTPADYLNTSLAFAAREFPGSRIPDPGSRLQDCVVWDDVEVDDDVRLRRCILTDGVRVPARSSWQNMTIRVAHGELMKAERLVGELAIGPINGSTLRR